MTQPLHSGCSGGSANSGRAKAWRACSNASRNSLPPSSCIEQILNRAGSMMGQEVLGATTGRATIGFQGNKPGSRTGCLEFLDAKARGETNPQAVDLHPLARLPGAHPLLPTLGVALESMPLGLTGPAVKRCQPDPLQARQPGQDAPDRAEAQTLSPGQPLPELAFTPQRITPAQVQHLALLLFCPLSSAHALRTTALAFQASPATPPITG
ncbi:hypothetical protein [Candidatus Spongiihabitans sp.]|uniref:hypothetical protein n=1 Tax=Candidatus Spongiihabitans sp. TaxID=3101308 RepID=UPI003C705BA3